MVAIKVKALEVVEAAAEAAEEVVGDEVQAVVEAEEAVVVVAEVPTNSRCISFATFSPRGRNAAMVTGANFFTEFVRHTHSRHMRRL